MYKLFIRKMLFLLQPETVHHLVVSVIKFCNYIPGCNYLLKKCYTYKNPILETEFLGIKFENPVGLAAGFDKNADFYNEFEAFGFGFIEIGTVTPLGQPGNPKPRSFRLKKDSALINRMGFNNNGVEQAVNNLKKRKTKIIIGGNIGKNTATPNENALNDYLKVFKELYNYVDYFVVNVSCPNIKDLRKLQDKDSLGSILHALINERKKYSVVKPLLLKISPDLTNEELDEIVILYNETGIDGIVATNTTTTRNNLSSEKTLIDSIGNGGLSGKPLTKRSTEIIRYLNEKSEGKIPIIGVGGIMNESDAMEKIEAGAKLVQIYTGFIYEGPALAKRINKKVAKQRFQRSIIRK